MEEIAFIGIFLTHWIDMIKNCLLRIALIFLIAVPVFAAELPEAHPLDKSESRTLVLDNGLKVLLVSDPDLNLASASMSVGVGSYMNPEGTQGLAHFLEHMLFLGTEKYPDVEAYKAYLSQNGGYSNAYTAGDHTNYHFQLYPDAFEGALDRFAQFFISPLFTDEYTERELNAIESEFAKNLEDDNWRNQRLFRMHTRADHPENHFSTGNKETLANVARDELIQFYKDYYSANQMALSLVSTQTLDQMEQWVREYFSAIPNHDTDMLRYPSRYIDDSEDVVRLIKMKAVEERRYLVLYFNTPSIRQDWDAKTSELIGAILGYEGEGSLLSTLKAKNLATSLGAGIWEGTADYTTASFGIDLTPQGRENYQEVIELVLGYIELLRQSPYPAYFFEEQRTMAKLHEVYSDKGEGAQRAVDLANRALALPLEVAEKAPTAFLRQDPEFYYEMLDRLRPDNMIAILSSRDIEGEQVEEIYGTEYTYLEIGDELFERLSNPEIAESFSLPKPNPFVPENVELLAERPVQLIDEPGLSLYYGQDQEFQRPKVAKYFKIHLPDREYTARDSVLLELYEAAVNEFVNEIAYDARMADLRYNISAGLEGVSLSVFGYSESAARLLPVLVQALENFEIEEALFNSIKERMVRGWNNARYDNAFMYIRYFTNQASYRDQFMPHAKAAAAGDISLDDVYALRDKLYKRGRIEALIYGNVTAGEAIQTARGLQDNLGIKAPRGDLYEPMLVELQPGESITIKDVLPTNNNAFRKDFILGMAEPQTRVAAAVLSNLIEAPYYSEMRTRQQLGYVVWSFTFDREDEVRLGFVIQSGEYDPVELVRRSDELVASFPALLRDMPSEAFAKAKEAVRSDIEKKAKTIGEKAARFFDIAYNRDANWSRKQESLDALEALTLDDVVALLELVNDPDQARYQQVLLFSRDLEDMAAGIEAVTDIDAWKAGQSFREVKEL
jgi:insulysin